MKESINSIIYQLRICREKTINISPFEAHFGRKANTPLSNISTEPDLSTLTYNSILKDNLDMETVRWYELLSEDQWDTEARSDIELEINRGQLSKDAAQRCNADPDEEQRLISHPGDGLAVPRTEASLTKKISEEKT